MHGLKTHSRPLAGLLFLGRPCYIHSSHVVLYGGLLIKDFPSGLFVVCLDRSLIDLLLQVIMAR